MSDPQDPLNLHQHRKRVIAREVQRANVESAQVTPADLADAVFTPAATDIENPGDAVRRIGPDPDAPVVIDPSSLGRRYRRSSHHRVYRWTQATALSAAGLAAVAIVCGVLDDLTLSRSLAIPACVFGVASIVLSTRTSLSARWRGWAIAATVFAAVALALTWLGPTITKNDPADFSIPKRSDRSPL